MKKRELIHLHALLAEVRRYLAVRGELAEDAFDAYEAHGVAPTAVYETKTRHREAILRLLDGLVAGSDGRGSTDEDADELPTEA